MKRANWIGAPEMFNLNAACRAIVDAYGWNVYLVGSAMERRDHRDVDVRCILDDDEFDVLFPGPMAKKGLWLDARASLLAAALSEWLASRTGLKIDFQFQRRTEANALYSSKDGHPRSALGIYVAHQDGPPRIVQRPNGCYAACIASLTSLPLESIPHPAEDDFTPETWTTYRNVINRFLRERGWWRAWIPAETPPKGYAIAHGQGTRGVGHCCIAKDGEVTVDPHPDERGLVSVEGFEMLVKCAPLAESGA